MLAKKDLKMDQNVKELWLKALRSGEYKQGRRQLRDTSDNFCCLGVLCDVIDPTKWKTASPELVSYTYEGFGGTLPESIQIYAEVPLNITSFLINMNDGGKSFTRIADYIEENV
jgi:hypothetical protein